MSASAWKGHGDQTATKDPLVMGPSCPMPTRLRLDLVHTSPVVTTALRRELRAGARPVRVDTAVHSWTDFQAEWDFAGDLIVLDALLDDHVPLPLKARALRRLGSHPVVLGPGRDTPFAGRAAAEGVVAWIEPTIGLADTAEIVREVAAGNTPPEAGVTPAGPPLAELTDRELQVLSLYASARGHSPTDLSRILALRTETVRSHIDRGRARYRSTGRATHNRAALRHALVDDGWFLDPTVWLDAGRR